jgi:hypothetical protein
MTEINKYQNGKIYKIEALNGEEGDIYIGSTTQPYLSSRMNQHRCFYTKNKNNCKSSLLFDKYGVENCNIILIESINAKNKMELHQREAHYIKTLKCVNKAIPLRTDSEYRKDNRDSINFKKNEYRKKNKEENNNKDMQYYFENKEIILEKRKKRYETNKEAILEKAKLNRDVYNARQRELYKLRKQQTVIS